jgi:hypothetical protein
MFSAVGSMSSDTRQLFLQHGGRRPHTYHVDVLHLGLLIIDKPTNAKLNNKHHITLGQVQAAIQWPARPRAKWEIHPIYGRRVVAIGQMDGEPVLCILKPVPRYDENADTWEVQTARWLRKS